MSVSKSYYGVAPTEGASRFAENVIAEVGSGNGYGPDILPPLDEQERLISGHLVETSYSARVATFVVVVAGGAPQSR